MNLPNKITLCRIFMIPLVVFFFLADFIPYGKLIAMLVFALASLTDFIDGKIARSRNLVTNLGKFLDPIADKVLVMTGFILLIATPITAHVADPAVLAQPAIMPYYVGIVAVIIILARDFVISAFRQIAATKNFVMAADMVGKVKTTFQMMTLVFYFAWAFVIEEFYVYTSEAWRTVNVVMNIVGYVLLAITVILTIVSAVRYIVQNKKVLKEE